MLDLQAILGTSTVGLTTLLAERELRAARQQGFLSKYSSTLVSFTLNIPGNRKAFPLAERTFQEGQNEILQRLAWADVPLLAREEWRNQAGYHALLAVAAPAEQVKELMMQIEESSPLGRIYDLDVLTANGAKLERRTPRTCLICAEPAYVCARSRKHPPEEVIRAALTLMADHLAGQLADQVAELCVRALLYEVAVTPKPGLVDRQNQGSHRDMDFFTFSRSAAGLSAYFGELTLLGIEHQWREPTELFGLIRWPGMKAEDHMLAVTGGVNTHKGLIFSFGMIAAAAGKLFGEGQLVNSDSLAEMARLMTANLLSDFAGTPETTGEILYADYGIEGIRGEVRRGFPSVRRYGLPVLRDLLEKGMHLDRAGSLTLLNLLAHVTDTNMIKRGGAALAERKRQEIAELIAETGLERISRERINRLDEEFRAQNLSPGGSADLLALTFLLHFCDTEEIASTQSMLTKVK